MRRTSVLAGIIACSPFAWGLTANAQLIPDGSLGLESSTINQISGIRQQIEGGALRGQNLFHSFQEFNVAPQSEVYFTNPLAVENILTRVTGGNVSQILGTLGINGDANLFLINPNGIYFGKDAHLDIRGSFTASTANGIKLGESGWFGAIASEQDQLLNIRPETRFDYALQQYSGNITNEGQLKAGKDLNLQAKNLFLSGQLGAQENLNLQATNMVKMRDAIDNPLQLLAGKNLLVEGLDTVDIFALNHLDSGLWSGGDMVLRSANTVGGDAHYYSGGDFRIEQLDGSLGDLFSPYDPVVRSSGNVSFSSYSGASLHIFAGGSVNVTGNIRITGVDTAANSIIENVALSNGNVISINGNTQRTLDIRAGTTAFGSPGITPSVATGFLPSRPTTNGTGTNANITIGSITNNGGVIFLTNQYFPNTLLTGGEIRVGGINTFNSGNGGAVTIDARTNITLTGNLNSYSYRTSGNTSNGGAVTLLANGNIVTQSIDSASQADFGSSLNGGAINMVAGGSITTRYLDSYSYSFNFGNAGNGGTVTLLAEGNISTQSIDSSSQSNFGNASKGGGINIMAEGNIITNNLYSYSQANSNSGTSSNGGSIILTAGNIISTNLLSSYTSAYNGYYTAGGDISLTSDGNISIGDINSYSSFYNSYYTAGGDISLISQNNLLTENIRSDVSFYNGYYAYGGDVFFASANDISTGNISSYIESLYAYYSISGDVFLASANDISTGNISSYINSLYGIGNNSGDIDLISNTGTISMDGRRIDSSLYGFGTGGDINIITSSLLLTNGSSLAAITSGLGNGGKVTINASDSVEFDGRSYVSSVVALGANGNAGGVEISTKTLELLGGSFIDASIFSSGNAGTVEIIATDSVKFDNESSVYSRVSEISFGNAGGVNISTKTIEVLGGSFIDASILGIGQAGTVKINAIDSVKFDGKSYVEITVRREAIGKAGDVDISTKSLELLGGSYLSANTFGQADAGIVKIVATDKVKFDGSGAESAVAPEAVGNAGGVDIFTKSLELLGGSNLSANTFGQGNAGSVKITATDSVKFDGESFAESVVATGAVGKAGGVDISTKTLELLGGSGLSASTVGQGDAGSVKINATNSVKLDGESGVLSTVGIGAVGKAGGVDISTKTIEMLGGSFFDASTFGQGDAGNVKIIATDSIRFEGQSFASSRVRTSGVGNAGGVDISTKTLELLGDSGLSASTSGQGDAGSVKITANDLNVTNNSSIETNTSSSGNAGNILVNISTLNLTNGGQIEAFTDGSGNGGTVTINALDFVKVGEGVQNFAPVISVETSNSGKAGDIIINTPNLTVSDTARITATATATSTNLDGGGRIILNANNMNLAGTVGIFAETQGQSPAGSLLLQTYQNNPNLNINLFTGSKISASTSGSGQGGDLIVTAPNKIDISGQGALAVETSSSGNAGNIKITAQNINLTDGVTLSASTSSSGDAGDIEIVANNFNLSNNATIQTNTSSSGDAGDISLNTSTLNVINGGQIFAFTEGSGNGGTVIVNAVNSVNIGEGVQNFAPIISVETSNAGKAGNIIVNTPKLTISDTARITATATATSTNPEGGGSILLNSDQMNLAGIVGVFAETQGQAPAGTLLLKPYQNNPDLNINLFSGSKISASTSGSGRGGDLIVTAPEDITISGAGTLAAETSGIGDAGNINITSQNFTLKDGVTISTLTSGKGNAGDIKLTIADNLNLFDSSIIASTTSNSEGNSGSINIDPKSTILDNSLIAVNSSGKGIGGGIFLVSNLLDLRNRSKINAETVNTFGGNIELQVPEFLFLRGGSNITASAGTVNSFGSGGNIKIVAPWIISFPNQDNNIIANAFNGAGGNINITTNALFGIRFTGKDILVRNDIDASSAFGLDGSVSINTPDVDPASGLNQLPENLVDADSLIGQNACAVENNKIADGSSFVVKGKGGLPDNPMDLATRTAIVDFMGDPNNIQAMTGSPTSQETTTSNEATISLAQGWQHFADGKIQLTGRSPQPQVIAPIFQHPNCI